MASKCILYIYIYKSTFYGPYSISFHFSSFLKIYVESLGLISPRKQSCYGFPKPNKPTKEVKFEGSLVARCLVPIYGPGPPYSKL